MSEHFFDQNRRETAVRFEEQFYKNPASSNAVIEQFIAFCAGNPDAIKQMQRIMAEGSAGY